MTTASPSALSAVSSALSDLNIDPSLTNTIMQAIDAAGYQLQEKAGGASVSIVSTLTPTGRAVEGKPGVYVFEVTTPGGATVAWVEFLGKTGTLLRNVRQS